MPKQNGRRLQLAQSYAAYCPWIGSAKMSEPMRIPSDDILEFLIRNVISEKPSVKCQIFDTQSRSTA